VRDEVLTVARVDGSDAHALAKTYDAFSWSPDSTRIALVTDNGSLVVAEADGTRQTVVARGTMPSWRPDGRFLAYVRGADDKPSVHVVASDGTADAVVEPGTRADVSPVWSPDGTQLAYWSSDGVTALLKVVRIGGNGGSVAFEIPGAVTNGAIVWAPDGSAIYGAGNRGLVRIDLATGKRRTLIGIPNGVFSPDGRLIAYTSGGECRDRVGIYVANTDGTNRRRLTNSCRVYGTDGPDTLHGSFSQVVLGLGGDDTLYADDTYYFFDGNTLYGGTGNDRLFGGFGQDDLYGGTGDDVLDGGPSADVLVGGPGRDLIFGGGGGDTIFAVDGRRDTISCGKNGYDRRDRVYADRIDIVARDCELVHRR
jgi:Tol biopolymer transport system component